CLPVPDPDLGERMCACVVVRPGTPPPAPADLLAFLREERGLDVRKLPEYVAVLPELPLGPTGKACTATLARAAAEAAAGERARSAGAVTAARSRRRTDRRAERRRTSR